jgi:integrase
MAKIKLQYVHEYVDRHGKPRRYFRKDGKRWPLPGAPGSDVFMAAYQACLAGGDPSPPDGGGAGGGGKTAKLEGSFGRLVTDFYASRMFRDDLKTSSRRVYRTVLEPLVAQHGHRAVSSMTPDAAARIIERIGSEKPAMANLTRAVLRKLMNFAVKSKMILANPVVGIEPYKTGEHHTWTDIELRQYEGHWKVGTRERLAYALLLYTAQRVGDAAAMTRSHIQDNEIYVVQEKTGAELWIPIHPELELALKACQTKGFALIGKADGTPFTTSGLGGFMARAIERAGLPERCVAHGLRKAMMRMMAEGNATVKQIAGVSGHKSLREIERYTKAADQRKLARAGMDKVGTQVANGKPQK